MPKPDIQSLIEGAYAAALDDSLWAGWSERMAREFGAQGALFWVVDRAEGEIRRSHVLFPQSDVAKVVSEYHGGYIDLDFRLKKAVRSGASEVLSDVDQLAPQTRQDHDFLAWQYDRVRTRHYLAAMVALPNKLKAGVSVHRRPDVGTFTLEERRLLEAMFDQFANAVRLGMQHNELLRTAWWDGLQSQSPDAAFLLDERGGVLRASDRAAQLLATGAISIRAGRIGCKDPSSNSRLEAIVARAVSADNALAGAITIPCPAGTEGCRLIVSPLSWKKRYLSPFEAAAILHVIDPQHARAVNGGALGALYGLTPAETRLAAALAAGHSLAGAAHMFGVTTGTVRAQLKAIFAKTGVNRQQDLILLVSSCR